MDDTEEMDAILSAKKKALDRLRSLSGDAMGERLKKKKKKPETAVTITIGQPGAEDLDDDDARRLMELYGRK